MMKNFFYVENRRRFLKLKFLALIGIILLIQPEKKGMKFSLMKRKVYLDG